MKKTSNTNEPFSDTEEWRYILVHELMQLTTEEKEKVIEFVAALKMQRISQSD